ncbi:hypothetical protein D7V72_22495 [bacterium D16-36]|nr:hypothetical protein D7V72_22495 [bacterium D16-36]
MARVVAIGTQDFEKLVANNSFYIDKTHFIKEWWESRDEVTLITRPRRFGKTLNLSMLERFWSLKYEGQGDIFHNLSIWKEEKYRKLQGTYPVIFLSFAIIKERDFRNARAKLYELLVKLYEQNSFLKKSGILGEKEIEYYNRISSNMSESDATLALYQMCDFLSRYYGKRVIILLDEYDTPMQEAYLHGYWEEMAAFMRSFFNASFKTNHWLERAVMTGITRISKESLFSDLNNLNVAAVTSKEYASCFGFTEGEVFAAMDEFGLTGKEEVKKWYDGFTIGNLLDIYNPWSVINFLDKGQLKTYWANTSSNGLAGSLLRAGSKAIKIQFEDLLSGKTIESRIHEEIVFDQLNGSDRAVWSLLLATGYLKVTAVHGRQYTLALTNYEVKQMFEDIILDWFDEGDTGYNGFIRALLSDDLKEMNAYMNQVALSMFSSFDGGMHPSEKANPERFYHGFVLGLLVDLSGRYEITSNRESGFGRYDVMLKPLRKEDTGIILEFKVHDPKEESSLEETAAAALKQIEEKKYDRTLLDLGLEKENIKKYGFAFEGKKVLIGESSPL